MPRRIGALAAAFALTHLAGCMFLSPDLRRQVTGEIEKPKVPEASVEAAARVDEVGRDLLAGTPLGIPEIAFQTIGSAEPEIFHPDPHTVYITEGLVNLCKTDDQLAAVLAHEVGHLTAEFRRTVRRQQPEPIPAAATSQLDRGTSHDPGREMYLAQFEKATRRTPSDKQSWPTTDPKAIAAELLRNASREPKLLAEVAPQLRQASRTRTLARQFEGAITEPRWTK
jgi:hypothetical protein